MDHEGVIQEDFVDSTLLIVLFASDRAVLVVIAISPLLRGINGLNLVSLIDILLF